MSRGSWVPAAILLCVWALTPACKSAEEKSSPNVVETALDKGVDTDHAAAKAVEPAPAVPGSASGAVEDSVRLDTHSGKVPADWPSEVPIYPGAKVALSMRLGRGITLALETPDSPAKITEFYSAKLAALERRSSSDLGKNQTLSWSDAAKPLQVTLAVTPHSGQPTRASLIVSRERPRRAAR